MSEKTSTITKLLAILGIALFIIRAKPIRAKQCQLLPATDHIDQS